MQKQDVREAQEREPASKGLLRVCSETREIADNTFGALTTQEGTLHFPFFTLVYRATEECT
jgi:hypothetical protein